MKARRTEWKPAGNGNIFIFRKPDRMESSRNSRNCNCIPAGFQDSGNPEIRIFGYPKVQISDFRISRFAGIRKAGYLYFQISENPDIRLSGCLDIRILSISGSRKRGYPVTQRTTEKGTPYYASTVDDHLLWTFGPMRCIFILHTIRRVLQCPHCLRSASKVQNT